MFKKSILLIPMAAIILSGCATCKKVNSLENRIVTLESKTGITSSQKESSESSFVSESTNTSSSINVPEIPSKKDIQNALKNAGFYSGPVDGKIGSKTKKAIEEFQKANSLKIDGKVGSVTWGKLKNYYSEISSSSTTQTKL